MSFWLQGLNPEQIQAVQHNFGPLLILAGAGSGKTTVLVSRTGRLISEGLARPDQILVLTFTNKSARELKHRVGRKIGDSAQGLMAGTFHSFGLRILKIHAEKAGLPKNFGIVDQTDCQGLVRELLRDIRVTGKDKFDLDLLLNLINKLRTGDAAKTEAFDEYHELAQALVEKFNRKLDLLGVVDFEGLLLKPIELFEKNKNVLESVQEQYQQIMVDEFQDTNRLQMRLVNLLAGSRQNLTVVGDDDQSIYGWRGAQVQNILQFPQNFKKCQVIKLERNYRSSSKILEMANQVVSKNRHRHGKILKPERKWKEEILPELFILENEEDESEFIVREIKYFLEQGRKLSDMAILYRSNSQGAWIESSLRKHRLEYSISGGSSIFERKEIKDVLAYLRQSVYPQDLTFKRIINTPPRGIGDQTLEKINEQAKIHKISFLQASSRWSEWGVHEKAGASLEVLMEFLKTWPRRLLDAPTEAPVQLSTLLDSSLLCEKLSGTPGERLLQSLRTMGYRDFLASQSTQVGAADKKWALVEIFSRILDNYLEKNGRKISALKDFLDSLMLRDNEDDETEKDKLQLMTLHASKGLEFPLVILAGLEEDLLPHKTLGSDIDEERRLFYVGITRAQERLILTRCQQRKKNGQIKRVSPSRFLLDIPRDLYTEYAQGVRPVSGQARENLVSQFLKSLEKPTESI